MNNNRMLITLGTPLGRWDQLAEHLHRQPSQGVERAEPAFAACHDPLPGLSVLNQPEPEAIARPIKYPPCGRTATQALCSASQVCQPAGGLQSSQRQDSLCAAVCRTEKAARPARCASVQTRHTLSVSSDVRRFKIRHESYRASRTEQCPCGLFIVSGKSSLSHSGIGN